MIVILARNVAIVNGAVIKVENYGDRWIIEINGVEIEVERGREKQFIDWLHMYNRHLPPEELERLTTFFNLAFHRKEEGA